MLQNAIDRLRFKVLGQRDLAREMVFGVGLSKTGTSSLDRAMAILGFRTIHYPPIANLKDGKCDLAWPWWMEKYNSANDLPVAATYRLLADRYENARFILTVRDIDGWLESCRKHFTEERAAGFVGVPRLEPARDLYLYMYGRTDFDEIDFRDAFNRHVDGVTDFFANRGDLTVVDIPGGDGWEKICDAVGKPQPNEEFPHRNARATVGAAPVDIV